MGKVFTLAEIEAAKKYKYSGTDNSIIARFILRPFWDKLIEYVPMWIAPNMITFAAFMIEFATFIVSFSFSDCLESEIPRWACILNGVSILIYQTLDNLDGRQARRTETSSALGQFFDHGCDAVNSIFIILKLVITLHIGNTFITYLFIFIMSIGFAFTAWEEYITHNFFLGIINAPDEGLLIIAFIHFAVGIYPPAVKLFRNKTFYLLYIIGASTSILPSIFNVIRKSISDRGAANRAMQSLIPIMISISLSFSNVFLCPQTVKNTFFIIFSGLILQYQSQMIIVSYLVNRNPSKLFNAPSIIYWILMGLGIIFPSMNTSLAIYGVILLSLIIVIIVFDVNIVDGLSNGLDISVFSIDDKGNEDDKLSISVEEETIEKPLDTEKEFDDIQ